MELILTNAEVNDIIKEHVLRKYNMKVIDISSYKPYTLQVSLAKETKKDENN